MRTEKLILIFLSGMFLITGCSKNTRAIKQTSARIESSVGSQKNAKGDLDKLSDKSEMAVKSGQIDEQTNDDIQEYIITQQSAIDEELMKLEKARLDLDSYKEGKSIEKQEEVIARSNEIIRESTQRLRILEEKTRVIVDFLDSETFSKAEVGALFRPGSYQMNESQVREGMRRFRPIVEKLYSFAEKYRDGFQTLRGNVIVTGYSDASPIQKGSALYRDLASYWSEDNPTSEDLNKVLSELRAKAVSELIKRIIEEKERAGMAGITIEIRTLGRGEEIPPGVGKDARANDAQRRIVSFYWVVLPEL